VNEGAYVFLGLAGAAAALDWVAVAQGNERLEYATKPAVMLFLLGLALTIDTSIEGRRLAIFIALFCSLAGDVFLMLRHSELSDGGTKFIQKGYFVPGLAAFLLAHLAYIVGFSIEGGPLWLALLILLAVRAATLPITTRLTKELAATGQSRLAGPIQAYALAISGMIAAVAADGEPLAIAAALLFLFSDFLIAWTRFVTALSWAPLAIIVTYHVGQAGLVVSLASV
jgi:uncharacterized membrane protein YhhN